MVDRRIGPSVRNSLLTELSRSERVSSCTEAQLRATAASWAICGTVLEWSRARSISAEELADAVLPLIATGLFLRDEEPRPALIRNLLRPEFLDSSERLPLLPR